MRDSNPFQGNFKKVLCVCTAGMLRSPTAALVLSQPPFGFNTRAVGIECGVALVPLSSRLLWWAEEIVCFEKDHAKRLKKLTDAPHHMPRHRRHLQLPRPGTREADRGAVRGEKAVTDNTPMKPHPHCEAYGYCVCNPKRDVGGTAIGSKPNPDSLNTNPVASSVVNANATPTETDMLMLTLFPIIGAVAKGVYTKEEAPERWERAIGYLRNDLSSAREEGREQGRREEREKRKPLTMAFIFSSESPFEYDQNDTVCVWYDELYDLRRSVLALPEVRELMKANELFAGLPCEVSAFGCPENSAVGRCYPCTAKSALAAFRELEKRMTPTGSKEGR